MYVCGCKRSGAASNGRPMLSTVLKVGRASTGSGSVQWTIQYSSAVVSEPSVVRLEPRHESKASSVYRRRAKADGSDSKTLQTLGATRHFMGLSPSCTVAALYFLRNPSDVVRFLLSSTWPKLQYIGRPISARCMAFAVNTILSPHPTPCFLHLTLLFSLSLSPALVRNRWTV
ncbi:hypothetical protein BCV70DRAFT_81806 [Testicularia cyperi]|uniref:Uncharacterized protein n=1 Tax=Testicularia cyperi TaxID=1882483 RepID=A0A317XH18_9BASI|nr:hypothetical protein BCV70DRAFT_81806 [Testicularia cyperi]